MRRTALLLMCVLALVGSMAAQEDRPPVSPDMRKLVEALGDKDWKVASGASKGLTDAGGPDRLRQVGRARRGRH
jgi:hypothetical protein